MNLKYGLEQEYTVTMDSEGKLYVGITLDWDYDKGKVETSMTGFSNTALHKFQHPAPRKFQHPPPPVGSHTVWKEQQNATRQQRHAPHCCRKTNITSTNSGQFPVLCMGCGQHHAQGVKIPSQNNKTNPLRIQPRKQFTYCTTVTPTLMPQSSSAAAE